MNMPNFLKSYSISRTIIVLALTIAVYLIPAPEGLSQSGKNAIAALVFTTSIFTLQPVSLPFSSLLVSISLVFLGVADAQQAFEPLSRPIIILILGSLFIAEAIRKHGISKRLALISITFSKGKTKNLLLGIMMITAFLSMWMENTATAAVLIPVVLTISNRISDPEKEREIKTLLIFGIAYAASLGGMATIMGSASNAVASGFIAEIQEMSFSKWAFYGLPSLIVLLPVTWLLILKMIPVSTEVINIEEAKDELSKLGGPQREELEVGLTLSVTILLWVIGPYLESLLQLPVTLFSPAVIGILASTYLSVRGLIHWEDVQGVSWGMFLTISAGLAMGDALIRTGASSWLMQLIKPLMVGPPVIVSLATIIFVSALLTNVMNNATVVAIFAPIMLAIGASEAAFNPLQFIIPLALATTFGYSLPSASGRMALITSMGLIDRKQMLKIGLVTTIVSSILLVLLFYLFSVAGLI